MAITSMVMPRCHQKELDQRETQKDSYRRRLAAGGMKEGVENISMKKPAINTIITIYVKDLQQRNACRAWKETNRDLGRIRKNDEPRNP